MLQYHSKLQPGPKALDRNFKKAEPVKAQATDGEATIYVYDEISPWGVNAKDFVAELNSVSGPVIHLRINSPGGDVFEARTMQVAMQQHPAKIITHIDGIAASAASFLALAGDEVEMAEGAFIMIHNAMGFFDVFGFFSAKDARALADKLLKEAEVTEKVDTSIANDYAKRTGAKPEQITAWMDAETWFSADEAVKNGFADRIYQAPTVENSFDLSGFRNAPAVLREKPAPKAPVYDLAGHMRRLKLMELENGAVPRAKQGEKK